MQSTKCHSATTSDKTKTYKNQKPPTNACVGNDWASMTIIELEMRIIDV